MLSFNYTCTCPAAIWENIGHERMAFRTVFYRQNCSNVISCCNEVCLNYQLRQYFCFIVQKLKFIFIVFWLGAHIKRFAYTQKTLFTLADYTSIQDCVGVSNRQTVLFDLAHRLGWDKLYIYNYNSCQLMEWGDLTLFPPTSSLSRGLISQNN